MAFPSLIHSIWLAQLGLQGLLAVVLLARKTWVQLPIFTVYSIFNLLTGISSYLLYKNPVLYFYVFWIEEGIAVILGLAVLYEIFIKVFSLHSALRKLATLAFRWAVTVLLGLGCAVVYFHSPSGLRNISSAVFVAAEVARILEVGLLMFLFTFSRVVGLHWRQVVFGVALGLGVFTTVELILVTVRSQLGAGAADVLSIIRMLAFNTGLLLWIGYLLAPERVTSVAELPKRTQLEQWNKAIMELINQ
jgi:hypothetical protein